MLLYFLSLIDAEENQSKFEKIFNKYKKLMLYVALDITKDHHLAQDAVQNSFLKIINHLDDIEDVSSHKTTNFIVIVTKNAAIDIQRSENRQHSIRQEDMSAFSDPKGSIDLTSFETQYILEKVNMLPDIYRDIVQLKIQYDLNDREISKILKISGPTARKRLERARKLLSELLKEADN